ncbi:hypothetical protein BDZ91DRAFT_795017 [Kalaharituber pfeilii]|nr:hypothetical protein BDZ91DRAFT_795017 [Kalaharituber pfeilii]
MTTSDLHQAPKSLSSGGTGLRFWQDPRLAVSVPRAGPSRFRFDFVMVWAALLISMSSLPWPSPNHFLTISTTPNASRTRLKSAPAIRSLPPHALTSTSFMYLVTVSTGYRLVTSFRGATCRLRRGGNAAGEEAHAWVERVRGAGGDAVVADVAGAVGGGVGGVEASHITNWL